MQEFSSALGEHVYRAELICYSLLLVVGVSQIIIRENFPKLNPPWPFIGITLMIFLFGVLLVPPLVLAIRVGKMPKVRISASAVC
jgi:hypothetical protein